MLAQPLHYYLVMNATKEATMTKTKTMKTVASYKVNGTTVLWGIIEYVAGDWAGIRQADGRLDEVPSHLVVIDPT